VNRTAQAVVLFLIGGAVLRAGFTDLYLQYVKAGLRPPLLAGGFVLIAAALATVWYEIRASRAARRGERDPAQAQAQPQAHLHAHGEPHR
jgi:hypothetical protein